MIFTKVAQIENTDLETDEVSPAGEADITAENADSVPGHLTEREFARRMHEIYAELNQAWNSRRDKSIAMKVSVLRWRKYFPQKYASPPLCF